MRGEDEITKILIQKGKKLLGQPYRPVKFANNPEADALLNNLEEYPHVFVLACVMDRQIKTEKAWLIPYKFFKETGGPEFKKLLPLDLNNVKKVFKNNNLHRFNDVMAENFYWAIQKIHQDYNDNASNIWKGKPKSATLVLRFLEFKGVGIKIATMAANILAREFKIPMSDYYSIDISPDVHVRRVFKRLGLILEGASIDELIYCARELNPKYPGIFDLSSWEIGRNWCHPKKPDCENCYLNKHCPKKDIRD